MIYEFRCRRCGRIIEKTINESCRCVCGDIMKRKFSFATTPPNRVFSPHYNASLGQYVTSYHHFDELLKQGSDKQSERTGIIHNYVRVDPHDVAHTVDGAGLYEEAKAISDIQQGLRVADAIQE